MTTLDYVVAVLALALLLMSAVVASATPLASATAATHVTYEQCQHCYLLKARRTHCR
jgi:hypothetical protein